MIGPQVYVARFGAMALRPHKALTLYSTPGKAAVNEVNERHSKRSAQFEDARQSRSVWTARVFSTAFERGMTVGKSSRANFHETGNDSRSVRLDNNGPR